MQYNILTGLSLDAWLRANFNAMQLYSMQSMQVVLHQSWECKEAQCINPGETQQLDIIHERDAIHL